MKLKTIKKQKLKNVSVYLTEELELRLKRLSARYEISISECIKQLITNGLK